jgi:hypothetical protein
MSARPALRPSSGCRKIENDVTKKAEPVWDPGQHPGSWRAVWAYSAKRAARDNKTLTIQENRARQIIAGEKKAKTSREAQNRTGIAIRNLVRQLRPLRSATIAINGAQQTFPPALSDGHREILQALKDPGITH